MKIIFLNSYSPRTGHNFIAQVIQIITECEIIPHPHAETRLSLFLSSYFSLKNELNLNGSASNFMDSIFIDHIPKALKEDYSNEYILLKDTNQEGVNYIRKIFPEEFHLLLYRDPRDTLVSIFKGMRFGKGKNLKSFLKKMGYFTGIYSYYYSKKYSERFMETIPDNIEDFKVIRYEDIVQRNSNALKEILEFFKSNMKVQEFSDKIDNILVINTSFYKEETGGKGIWDTKERTEKFNPISRKKIPYLHRKGIEFGSKKFRKKLGYL